MASWSRCQRGDTICLPLTMIDSSVKFSNVIFKIGVKLFFESHFWRYFGRVRYLINILSLPLLRGLETVRNFCCLVFLCYISRLSTELRYFLGFLFLILPHLLNKFGLILNFRVTFTILNAKIIFIFLNLLWRFHNGFDLNRRLFNLILSAIGSRNLILTSLRSICNRNILTSWLVLFGRLNWFLRFILLN